MTRCCLIFVLALTVASQLRGQGFEVVDKQDSYQAAISETIQIPIRVKNTTDKPQTYVVRREGSESNGFQKGYFCLGRNCAEQAVDEISRRVEPGETLDLYYTLETGLVTGPAALKFQIVARGGQHTLEHNISVQIDEKRESSFVFQSRDITIHDVYPNPVVDQAFIDYRIHTESI